MPFNDVIYFILYVSFDLFAQYLKPKLQKRKKSIIYCTILQLNYLHKFSYNVFKNSKRIPGLKNSKKLWTLGTVFPLYKVLDPFF